VERLLPNRAALNVEVALQEHHRQEWQEQGRQSPPRVGLRSLAMQQPGEQRRRRQQRSELPDHESGPSQRAGGG
jgi:hypothetical protein